MSSRESAREPEPALTGFGRYAGPATLILASLADGAKHGYALTKDIESFSGVRLAPGTLYEALARLQAQGLIEPVESHDRRRPYQLTAVGAQALPGVSRRRKAIALGLAAVSDVVQMALFPAFVEGATSPFELALDAATAIAILLVVGFQWRLAIALAVELIPGVDLFPTWTAVVATLPVQPASTPPAPEPPSRLPL